MHGSWLELIMMLCFGGAWPFSVYKSLVTKTTGSKSLLFLIIVFVGYVAGIFHKFFFDFDYVTWFYVINAFMVLADIALYIRNRYLFEKPGLKLVLKER